MRDANHLLGRYRDCGIALWEKYFREVLEADHLSRHCWHYDQTMERLLHALVLEPLGLFLPVATGIRNEALPIQVQPLLLSTEAVLISRDPDGGPYWDYKWDDHTLQAFAFGFLGFFDFDQIKGRSLEYVRTRIIRSEAVPDLVGHHALIRYRHAAFQVA